MDITVIPGMLKGAVTPPPSKSEAHRALIAASLGRGTSTLSNVALSQDVRATLSCLSALRARAEWTGPDQLQIRGMGDSIPRVRDLPTLDCWESGSTLRFLIPVALLAAGGGIFTGRGRLMERPQDPYFSLFQEKGIRYGRSGSALTVQGQLEPGTFSLPGNVSSQFITGLLFVLPLLKGDSRIRLTTPLESRGYVDLTLDVLRQFGVRVQDEGDSFLVPGGQSYQSLDWTVEGDWSQAAFWYAANFSGGQVEIRGLRMDSIQGDREIGTDYWKLAKPGELELDVSQCPDLVPPLAAMAAVRRGETRLVNAARLRMKESDRLTAVTRALRSLGAQVEEGADSLTIRGRDKLPGGGTVDCCNDHRIAMMAAVSAAFCQSPVKLLGAECVNKSYPNFWAHFQKLGGQIHGFVLR